MAKIHDPAGRISLHDHEQRVAIRAAGEVIADTRRAVALRETGYPERLYVPREDVTMSRLTRTETVTHCPFKGDASYFSIASDGETLPDAVWSYEKPFDAMSRIAGLLCFDPAVVDVRIGES